MDVKKGLAKSILIATGLWFAWSSTGYAFNGALNAGLFPPSQSNLIHDNNRTVVTTFSNNLQLAFQETLEDKHPLLSLYYRDLSTNAGSVYAMSDSERMSESRLLTRQALYKALQETVNDVNLLYTIKEYGRAITSARMKVKDGNVSVEGPSMDHAGNHSDPSPNDGFRSSLMLVNNAHFGFTFRTNFGSYRSNLTYFLAGHDMMSASLQRDLSQHSKMTFEYRYAPSENTALVSLQIPFQY